MRGLVNWLDCICSCSMLQLQSLLLLQVNCCTCTHRYIYLPGYENLWEEREREKRNNYFSCSTAIFHPPSLSRSLPFSWQALQNSTLRHSCREINCFPSYFNKRSVKKKAQWVWSSYDVFLIWKKYVSKCAAVGENNVFGLPILSLIGH